MIKELRKHWIEYLVLLLIVLVHGFLFIRFWPNKTAQQITAASLGAVYFLWGIIHHVLSGTMHRKVVLEYFFVSIFATSVLMMLVE